MNLLIDTFSGLHDLREETNVHDPLTNVLVIAVSVSIAEMETCKVSFSTERVKRPISPRL